MQGGVSGHLAFARRSLRVRPRETHAERLIAQGGGSLLVFSRSGVHAVGMNGPLWIKMNAQPRIAMSELRAEQLPGAQSGVYALYRDGVPVYVGVAAKQSLRGRVWGSHRGRGRSMTGSALRRNVAEYLGIAPAQAIKARGYIPTASDAARVVAWLDECEIGWVTCRSSNDATDLESAMKVEWMPNLTKR